MFRFLKIVVLGLFFIWIMPLGVFYDLAKEKLACNGQRAICLCKHLMVKQKGSGKIAFKGPAEAPKEKSSSSSSHDFILAQKTDAVLPRNKNWFKEFACKYSLLLSNPLEHVPKA